MGNSLTRWFATANRETRLGLAALWAMLGCGGLLFAIPAYAEVTFWWNGLAAEGRVATAPVEMANPPKFGGKYTVEYEYSDAAGNVHRGIGTVRSASEFKPGDPIAVRYLRADAAQSRLEGNLRFGPPVVLASLGLAILVWAIWYGVGGVRRVNETVRVAAD